MTNTIAGIFHRDYDAVADHYGFVSDPGIDGLAYAAGDLAAILQVTDYNELQLRVFVVDWTREDEDAAPVVVWQKALDRPFRGELARALEEAMQIVEDGRPASAVEAGGTQL